MKRSYIKNATTKIGEEVLLQGWAENIRLIGKVAFIELRDSSARIQCVCTVETLKDNFEEVKKTTIESVLQIRGIVKKKPSKNEGENIDVSMLEIEVLKIEILNKCFPLAIPVNTDGYSIKEESRFKYRYLDLRRERMHRNILARSNFSKYIREFLYQENFIEVETPILSAPTMEGARDFLVPSRMQKSKFYALPQSPQQYKQLLMTAGIDRYFQFAKCVRDENLRADRGFEFTQIDLEVSFTNQEEILHLVESMILYAVNKIGGKIKSEPFPRFTYSEAINQFGADKFDLRTNEEKEEGILAFAWVNRFPFFKKVDKNDISELRDGKSGWTFTHNPFSAPEDEFVEWHKSGVNIEQIIAQQYDLVCNGFEVGGGSIRAHNPNVLKSTYKIMGYSDTEIEKNIGHILEAFNFGTPPHGGIALGLDRLITLIQNEASLKEVVAFPMTYNGNTSVMNAPLSVSPEQLNDFGINFENLNNE